VTFGGKMSTNIPGQVSERRPGLVWLASGLLSLQALGNGFVALVILVDITDQVDHGQDVGAGTIIGAMISIGLFVGYLALAIGIFRGKEWARTPAIVLTFFALLLTAVFLLVSGNVLLLGGAAVQLGLLITLAKDAVGSWCQP